MAYKINTETDKLKRCEIGRDTAYRSWESILEDLNRGNTVSNERIVHAMEQCNRWDYEIIELKYKIAQQPVA